MADEGHLKYDSCGDSPLVRSCNEQIDFERYRRMVRGYIDKHQYTTALFWADKLASLSGENSDDIYTMAHCLYLTKQYHRAAHCIESRNLHKANLNFKILAVSSRLAGKEYKEALEISEAPLLDSFRPESSSDDFFSQHQLEASLHLLKGKANEAIENRSVAAECYKKALALDIHCYEAFDALVKHQMLSREEEESVLNLLTMAMGASCEDSEFVRLLYGTKVKKYDKPDPSELPSELSQLSDNLDIATAVAERCYYNCDYKRCYTITSSVLSRDPYLMECVPIHIACLMELGKSNDLFYLAHKLVDMYPENAISWFAVGCYYYLIGKAGSARRYLSKATVLDPVFGPAWLMYGHSFAMESEHDQAMAAYFKALQLIKGCHLPFLYIGLEYGLTNNTKLAERFFSQALAIAPSDPFVLHEMGVVAFQNQEYPTAKRHFENALSLLQANEHSVLPEKWEPLLNNLGHTYRKLRKFNRALEYHQQALVLSPKNASTLSALGFVHCLMRHWSQAVDYFHKALGLQRDDAFSTTMLSQAIEQQMNELQPCKGVPEVLPEYTSSDSPLSSAVDMDVTNASCQSQEYDIDSTN
ncbi:cell division cycle protein 16 homolog [Rhipicephalus sanguineus]|uniref:cell division cycle protein 16 homolog n=1 Tax=Rhipicephalus sanguineus TaxID=34632 RepID=UPI001894A9ED|nr:cell division cycle protein 16 homolog [Rhipicephalus sanguineus]